MEQERQWLDWPAASAASRRPIVTDAWTEAPVRRDAGTEGSWDFGAIDWLTEDRSANRHAGVG